MTVIILSILLLGLGFAGIAVKILLKKNGQFAGTCASNNPMLREEGGTCGYCGAKVDEECKSSK